MAELKVGDKAPDFKGLNEKGEEISLSDYSGKKLVLFFYPKDMTPGCTAAACSLRDNFSTLQAKGYEVLGVSPDSVTRHKKFIDKYDFPYSLLADEEKETIKAYGLWQLKKFMGKEYMGVVRTTFLIDENGVIEHIFGKVKTKVHGDQVLETINS